MNEKLEAARQCGVIAVVIRNPENMRNDENAYSEESLYNVYTSEDVSNKLKFNINKIYSKVKINFMGSYHDASTAGDFRIGTDSNVPSGNAFISDNGYGITNFIMLYLIGAYIRLYYDNKKISKLILFIIYICLSLLGTFIYYKYPNAINYNFIINIINSIVVFLLFKNIKITKGKILSKFAECSLAIYIIHENSFIRAYIYQNVFQTSSFYNSSFLVINMLYTCIAIFILCSIIEFIRKQLFKITINKLIDKSKLLNKIISI